MTDPHDFFTLGSLATFAGAVGATTVIANGCQRAFNFNPRWLALAIAQGICIGVVLVSGTQKPFDSMALMMNLLVAVVNGFLVYTSAAGLTGAINTSVEQNNELDDRSVIRKNLPRRRFFTPWFP